MRGCVFFDMIQVSTSKHYDGSFVRTEGDRAGEKTFLTVQVYLNADFGGGRTSFPSTKGLEHSLTAVAVEPLAGRAIVFQHDVAHGSTSVIHGRKYAVRLDVLYEAAPPDGK